MFYFLATTVLASMRLSSSRLARKRSLLLLLLLWWWRGFTSYRSRLNTGFSKATWPPELPLLLGIAPEISTRERKAADYGLFFIWSYLLEKNDGTKSIELVIPEYPSYKKPISYHFPHPANNSYVNCSTYFGICFL